MKVKVALILLSTVLELSFADPRNPSYRVERSNRKKKESYDYSFDYDTAAQQGEQHGGQHGGQVDDIDSEYHQTESVGKSGYSEGSGLRSIAQGSADQASSAVANQHLAAKQASYIAQNNLANLALQASATAAAALQGKEVLLAKIEQENLDAHQQLEVELQQLRQAKRSAKAAQQAAAQSMNHLAILQSALNNAQSSSEHSQQAANEASAELASQTNMVGKAKQRVEHVEEQLHQARVDYEATVKAANEASASAQTAQNNAAEAAVKASISSLHDIHSTLPSHGQSSSSSGYENSAPSYSGGSEPSGYQGSSGYESDGIEYSGASGSYDTSASQKHKSIATASSKGKDQQVKGSSPKAATTVTVTVKSSPVKSSQSPASPPKSAKQPQLNFKPTEKIAINHNYHSGSNEFRPSRQYSYAGY